MASILLKSLERKMWSVFQIWQTVLSLATAKIIREEIREAKYT